MRNTRARQLACALAFAFALPACGRTLLESAGDDQSLDGGRDARGRGDGAIPDADDERPHPEDPCVAPSGALDPSFGENGVTAPLFLPRGTPKPPLDNETVWGAALAIAVRPTGEIVVLGEGRYSDGLFGVLVQFLPDGTLDPAFGSGGVVRLGVSGTRILLQPDGGVVVGYGLSSAQCGILRYLPDGRPDPTLSSSAGFLRGACTLTGLAFAPDGKIVFGGWARTGTTRQDPDELFVCRALPESGTFDTEFAGGRFETSLPFSRGQVTDLAVQDDGAIVMAGISYPIEDDDAAATGFLARVNAHGALDPAFGNAGKLVAGFAESVYSVAVDDTGIVLGGRSFEAGSPWPTVGRFQRTDGAPDTTFGTAGVATFEALKGAVDKVLILPDRRLVAMATVEPLGADGQIISFDRVSQYGTPDLTFGNGGQSELDSLGTITGSDMAVQSNGRIVAAGARTDERGYSDISVVRICP